MSLLKHRRLIYGSALLVMVIGSTALFRVAQKNVERFVYTRVEAASTDITNRISSRIMIYSSVLYDTAAFVSTNKNLNAEQWHQYISSTKVFERYSGISVIGYAPVIPADQEDSLERGAARSGVANYNIYPSRSTLVESPVLFLDPLDDNTRKVLGFNLFSEEKRRMAMEFAIDHNEIGASDIIIPIADRDKPNPRIGVVIFLPIYKSGSDISSVEKRRANIEAFVTAGLIPKEMVNGVSLNSLPGIKFQVFDDSKHGELSDSNLIYNSGDSDLVGLGSISQFMTLKKVQWPNTSWHLRFIALPDEPLARFMQFIPIAVLITSLILSVLLILLLKKILDSYEKMRLTASESIERLNAEDAVVDAYEDGIIATNVLGLITVFNRKAEQVLGYSELEVIKQKTLVSLITDDCTKKHIKQFIQETNMPLGKTFDCLITRSLIDGQDQIDLEFITKTGRTVKIPVNVRPLYDSTNFLLGYQFIFR